MRTLTMLLRMFVVGACGSGGSHDAAADAHPRTVPVSCKPSRARVCP